MTDLVERLRARLTVTMPPTTEAEELTPAIETIRRMMTERAEAADEIERLISKTERAYKKGYNDARAAGAAELEWLRKENVTLKETLEE